MRESLSGLVHDERTLQGCLPLWFSPHFRNRTLLERKRDALLSSALDKTSDRVIGATESTQKLCITICVMLYFRILESKLHEPWHIIRISFYIQTGRDDEFQGQLINSHGAPYRNSKVAGASAGESFNATKENSLNAHGDNQNR